MNGENLDCIGKNITVIGGGVIGASWAVVFLSAGLNVTISDPADGIDEKVKQYVTSALSELSIMGDGLYVSDTLIKKLRFEKNIARAVQYADFIQENGPEKESFKVNLWSEVEKYAPSHTLFLSSSSGITATKQSVSMSRPERLMVGHPFNPPHLMPLVEVVPGEVRDSGLVAQALSFYNALGKAAILINKEIAGFVANRLQAAIFKECIYLVQKGIVKVDELDDIMTSSLGIRWATGGPFLSFHLGGGHDGFLHFLEHLAPEMAVLWEQQEQCDVSFDDETRTMLMRQIDDTYGLHTVEQLEEKRNIKEISVLKSLRQ
ncbi:hydroxylacyl-CoA dehydrogenase [Trabulsiella odontotermitis]|uniref:L-gulonate 3-dehydrogenase n=2 Tax=Trabulsiella odontotermitis TaxID=379893 RepID=A0A0L0GU88_9ENTR|nr:hydroxylacyl-CoA dehydrogenase [Trabulsiella odontotermitis]